MSDAENAARLALATYANKSDPKTEAIACYEFVLARILAAQRRFHEAVPFGIAAIEHYAVFHNPPDDFLLFVQKDVDLMIVNRDRNSTTPS